MQSVEQIDKGLDKGWQRIKRFTFERAVHQLYKKIVCQKDKRVYKECKECGWPCLENTFALGASCFSQEHKGTPLWQVAWQRCKATIPSLWLAVSTCLHPSISILRPNVRRASSQSRTAVTVNIKIIDYLWTALSTRLSNMENWRTGYWEDPRMTEGCKTLTDAKAQLVADSLRQIPTLFTWPCLSDLHLLMQLKQLKQHTALWPPSRTRGELLNKMSEKLFAVKRRDWKTITTLGEQPVEFLSKWGEYSSIASSFFSHVYCFEFSSNSLSAICTCSTGFLHIPWRESWGLGVRSLRT